VEAPIFAPAPRAIDRPLTITISTHTVSSGSVEEVIYYTLDGSEPRRQTALKYDAPVRVSPGQTLKAVATLRGWRDSAVTTGEFPVVGTTRPATMPTTASAPARTMPALAR
jgi:hypothetical protein